MTPDARAVLRIIPVALVLAGLAVACASTPNGDSAALAGCWYFERDAAARHLNLPWGVHLTPDTVVGWPEARTQPAPYRAVTLIRPGETQDHPFGYWRDLPGDSVRIGYPGMGGMVLDLVVAGAEMTGQARPVGDAGLGERPTHPVRLGLARCPEE